MTSGDPEIRRPAFGGVGSSSSLITRHDGASPASASRNSAVIWTPELAGWSCTTIGSDTADATAR